MLTSFSEMWDGKLGEVKGIEHQIRLAKGGKLFRSQYYQAEPRARQVEQKSVDDMPNSGVIVPSYSKWSSLVFLVLNSDASLRFCVNYGKLNAITVCDTYAISEMDECRDSLGDATTYSALDCNFAYWQIPMENDRHLSWGYILIPSNAIRAIERIRYISAYTVLSGYRWKRRLI